MASVNFMKCSGSGLAGLRKHLDKELRKKLDHSNPDINKELVDLDYFIGASNYREIVKKCDDFVKKMDEKYPPKRIKSDRQTCFSAIIYCPPEVMESGREKEFFEDAYAALGACVGEANLQGAAVHLDEVHSYIDSKTKQERESRYHMHAIGTCGAIWNDKETIYGDDGKPMRDDKGKIMKQTVKRTGINCKHFMTRTLFEEVNQSIDKLCREKYHCVYMTGEGKNYETTERMKAKSAELAREKAERELQSVNSEIMASLSELHGDYVSDDKGEYDFNGHGLLEELEKARREKERLENEINTMQTQMYTSQQLGELYTVADKFLKSAEQPARDNCINFLNTSEGKDLRVRYKDNSNMADLINALNSRGVSATADRLCWEVRTDRNNTNAFTKLPHGGYVTTAIDKFLKVLEPLAEVFRARDFHSMFKRLSGRLDEVENQINTKLTPAEKEVQEFEARALASDEDIDTGIDIDDDIEIDDGMSI